MYNVHMYVYGQEGKRKVSVTKGGCDMMMQWWWFDPERERHTYLRSYSYSRYNTRVLGTSSSLTWQVTNDRTLRGGVQGHLVGFFP